MSILRTDELARGKVPILQHGPFDIVLDMSFFKDGEAVLNEVVLHCVDAKLGLRYKNFEAALFEMFGALDMMKQRRWSAEQWGLYKRQELKPVPQIEVAN